MLRSGTRKIPPGQSPPVNSPDQISPNLTLTLTLTLTLLGIQRGEIDQEGIFRTPKLKLGIFSKVK